ncbi:MAG: hypothetical protein HF981_19385 [Desulfobacteraceae bacterium]|nr:hypothetical protein [Desulfobacteraceae bacterium]MBC2752565.1 hypothetical protein [Desulfobacteraceae bacterium]
MPTVAIEGEAMTAELTIRVDAESGAPFIRNYTTLEKFDDGPEKYVDLQYSEHRNPGYVCVTAINHHPDKTIKAYFYTLKDDGSGFIPGSWPDRTIKACLKPSETTVVHLDEKQHNPRLFLFNASFDECDLNG